MSQNWAMATRLAGPSGVRHARHAFGCEFSVSWLKQQLFGSGSVETRRRAVRELGRYPSRRGCLALAEALRDPDAQVRVLAAAALGKFSGPAKIEPLVSALQDPQPEVVTAALVGLRDTPVPQVVQALGPLLRHPDAAVRGQAAKSLSTAGWQAKDDEDRIWLHVSRGQFAQAASMGPAAIPALEAAIKSSSFGLCIRAVEALGTISDYRIVRPLLETLESPDPSVCIAVLDVLKDLGSRETLEPVLARLNHQSPHVRVAAIEALRQIGATEAVEPIQALLARDPSWDVRRAAAEALGRFEAPEALDALAGALEDSDPDVRECAASALGNLRDRQAIFPLVRALKDRHSGVRRIAIAALARIDPSWSSSDEAFAAAEELKPALQDSDQTVRYFVSQLLGSMGVTAPQTTLSGSSDELAASGPAKRRKMAVRLFITVLGHVDRDLRQAAAEALGRLGDKLAEPALARMLLDPDSDVRTAADLSLQSLGAAMRAAPP